MNKPRIWPVLLASLIGIAILLALGLWQLHRLEWKQAIIADIAARQQAEPMPLAEALAVAETDGDIEFRRIDTQAKFIPGREFHLLTTFDSNPGWQIVTPALTADGIFVLVDRGVVPDEERDDPSRLAGDGSSVRLNGIIRRHRESRSVFSPDNDPARNLWLWWDAPAMIGEAAPPPGAKVAPFILQLTPQDGVTSFPRPLPPDSGLTNNHFQYALTWFSLAAVLAVMAAFFIRSLLRRSGA